MPRGWVDLTENRVVSLRQGKILGSCGHSPRCKLCLQQVEVGRTMWLEHVENALSCYRYFGLWFCLRLLMAARWITTCIYFVDCSASGPLLYNLFWWISCLVSLHWDSSFEGRISTIRESNVYWTVHHCNSWRMKDQLDVTCYFISLLMCSACFGH